MAKPYAQGSIAGVDLKKDGVNCQCFIVDGGAFKLGLRGSMALAADGSPKVQILVTGQKGIVFGVHLTYFPVSVFDAVLTAIVNAIGGGSTFVVALQDELHTINHNCTWDFSAAPNGPTYPEQRTSAESIKDVTLRLVTTGAVSP